MNIARMKVISTNDQLEFYLYFYGLKAQDLLVIPNEYISAACNRRGFTPENGFVISPFFVEHVR